MEDLECQSELKDSVFIGHAQADTDSVVSAVAAAELFGGVASRASDLNGETKFVLEYWEIEQPQPFSEVSGDRPIVLVDHNQASQFAPGLDNSRVVGVIDHHALQSRTVETTKAAYVDIRPWGSTSTILAHTYLRKRRAIPPAIAGLLLSGILSDTLNLRSPTTTRSDRIMLDVLASLSGCKDTAHLAQEMFKAYFHP